MKTQADFAARLLREAAEFFRTISQTNENIKEQMEGNAEMYDKVADLVETDPAGIVRDGE